LGAVLSLVSMALLASTVAATSRAGDRPGQKWADELAASLGKGVRGCEGEQCMAQAEAKCQRARYAFSAAPGEHVRIFVDEFVAPTQAGCLFVTIRDYGAFEGGWVERETCRVTEGRRDDCATERVGASAKSEEPRRFFADIEFERLRARAFDPRWLGLGARFEVRFSGMPQLEGAAIVVVTGPYGREALLRPGDRVGAEGHRFVEWHPVPAGECGDFRDEKGTLEQLCHRQGTLGDFGEP